MPSVREMCSNHDSLLPSINDVGQCKWRYAIVDGTKTDIFDAEKGVHGVCPLCGNELVPRKGDVRNWHWAHVAGRGCDDWYEPKGAWHRGWQNCFERSWQEVPVIKPICGVEKRHIADVKTTNGWTIEFQYSHLPNDGINERQAFYGEMVWVVAGMRLDRDKLKGECIMACQESFVSENGIKYLLARSSDLPSGGFWMERGKFVFFDFEGSFDKPVFDGDLLCLLPETIDGNKLLAIVPKSRLIENFRNGNERSFLDQISRSGQSYLEKYAEFAKFAITLGWVQAALWIKGRIAQPIISDGVSKDVPWGNRGWIAIHCQNDYTKDNYYADVQYVKAEGLLNVDGVLGEEQSDVIPDYWQLKDWEGAIVAKAEYEKDTTGSRCSLKLFNFTMLKDASGGVSMLRGISDGKDVWKMSDELANAVNGCFSKGFVAHPAKADKRVGTYEKIGYVYTGKGNLYRDAKTNWLHICKNDVMIPLKAENQDWDKTYDEHFGKRRYY